MELPDNEPPDKGVPENDISINELIDMGKRYLLIPLGLLFVEIIYSILTASQDTLSWIQEIVAKIWNNLNQTFFGNESSTLSEYGDSGYITTNNYNIGSILF